MKAKAFVLIFWITAYAFGQQTQAWLSKLEYPIYEIDKLKEPNKKDAYVQYNFSTLLVPRTDFLGYIGKNYKRLRIFYTTIKQDDTNPEIYLVKGKTVVDHHINDFTGQIKIDQIREYKSMHYGVDDMYKEAGIQSQGVLIGQYTLVEDATQQHHGTFKGIVTLKWYVDKFGLMHYDDIERFSDGYRNNQYVGTWTSATTGKTKTCNWGERRIPFSDELDGGAGAFSPVKKYRNNGWEDFVQ